MNNKKFILTRGISGSGKSTYAKKWVSESPETRIRINNDDIRNMLGVYWVPSRENVVSHIKEESAKCAMSLGYDIIVDNMNLNPKEVNYWEAIVKEHNESNNCNNYTIEFKDFFLGVEECIRRDSLRPNPIGEQVIKSQWKKYKDFILGIENQTLYDRLNSQDASLPPAIIVDLDATVALNISGRPYFGDGCKEGIKFDEPIIPIIQIVERYQGHVIFITGRDYSVEEETKAWIKEHIHIPEYTLLMREIGDYSKGDISKLNLYYKYVKDKYYIEFVLEDSDKCVKMYRDLGLTVLQPNEGKY
jgi:predicted kinase